MPSSKKARIRGSTFITQPELWRLRSDTHAEENHSCFEGMCRLNSLLKSSQIPACTPGRGIFGQKETDQTGHVAKREHLYVPPASVGNTWPLRPEFSHLLPKSCALYRTFTSRSKDPGHVACMIVGGSSAHLSLGHTLRPKDLKEMTVYP